MVWSMTIPRDPLRLLGVVVPGAVVRRGKKRAISTSPSHYGVKSHNTRFAGVIGFRRSVVRKVESQIASRFTTSGGHLSKEGSRRLRCAYQCFRAIRATLAAAKVRVKGDPFRVPARSGAMKQWCRIASAIVLAVLFRSEFRAIKMVKAWCLSIRRNWLLYQSHRERNPLQKLGEELKVVDLGLQLSFAARALPKLSGKRWHKRELASLRERLAQPVSPLPRWFVERIESFSAGLGYRGTGHVPLEDRVEPLPAAKAGGSAALGFSRRDGGRSAAQENLPAAPEEEKWDPQRPEGVDEEDFRECVNDARGYYRARHAALKWLGRTPPAEAIVLPEGGAKFRVATKSPAELLAYGDRLRKRLFPLLIREPETRRLLEGNPRKAIDEVMRVWERPAIVPRVTVSADATAATDLLHHDAAAAVWRGLCEGTQYFSDEEYRVGLLLLGPMELTAGGETVTTKRGVLMGLPLSWLVYSVYHAFLWSEARRTSGTPLTRREEPFALCGDDLLGVASRATNAQYERLFTLGQGRFSAGKHFVVAAPRGCFVEMFANGRQILETVSVAGLVHTGSDDATRFSEEVSALAPAWVLAGLAVEGALRNAPGLFNEIRRAQRECFPGLARWGRGRGLVPYLPRFLGGMGLLRSDSLIREAPPGTASALVCFATDESASADRSRLERIWAFSGASDAMAMAVADAEEAFGHSFSVIDRLTTPKSQGPGLEVLEGGRGPIAASGLSRDKLLKAVATSRARTYESFGVGRQGKTWSVRPRAISKSVRAAWRGLVRSFFGRGGASIARLRELQAQWQSRYEGAVRITDRRLRASGQNPLYIPVLGHRNPIVGQRVMYDALWLPRSGHRPDEER